MGGCMQAVNIVMRDMPHSDALEEHIRKKAEKLTQHYRRINSCHVAIDIPQKHKRNGKLFQIRIDLTVPGSEIVVNHKLNEDVYVAIRDAFAAVIRKLDSYVCKRRGDVKCHDSANYGYVSKLFPQENYGFIQGIDGNEFYFSMTNVTHPSFEQLEIGDMVQFLGITSGEGFQAHRVTKERKAILVEEAS